MPVRLFLQIGHRQAIPIEYFSTLCGVPDAGDCYWSMKRRRGAVTHWQIVQPIGNKLRLFR